MGCCYASNNYEIKTSDKKYKIIKKEIGVLIEMVESYEVAGSPINFFSDDIERELTAEERNQAIVIANLVNKMRIDVKVLNKIVEEFDYPPEEGLAGVVS